MKRRIVCGSVAALAALAVGMLPGATAQAAGRSQFHPVTVAKHGVVSVRSLPRQSPPGLIAARRPVLRLTDTATPGPASKVATIQPAVATTTTAAQRIVSSFAGASLDLQLPLGADEFVTPPDPQIAAGPSQLLEMVNSSGSVWDKQGNLLKLFDLNLFFRVPTGYSFSDPRVVYDSDSGRWFASGVAFIPPTYASVVVLAVSSSSDATGTWFQYTAADSPNLTHDQPKIGISSDKVVISWNDFLMAAFFQGQSTWVLQKSQMVAGSTQVAGAALGPDSTRSSIVPAVQLTTNSDEFLVFNGTDCGTLGGNCIGAIGVVRISGTPLQGNVAWNESDPGLANTSSPPNADQPGMPGSIATNDDRFLTAIWENGVLWTGGNDACVPPNETATRTCSRLVQVTTAGPTVVQNFDIASTGGGLYYPAFAMDLAGDMYVAYNISSSTQNVGMRITGQVASAPPQTVAPGQTIRAGDATYNMNPCFGTNQTSRWGDYNGGAIDPQNPGNVWVLAEFAAIGSTANGDLGCDWATFTGQLTFSATPPAATLTSISPTSGPAAGGTAMTFTGTGFDTAGGMTIFSFGGTAATGVSCSSSTSCTGTSPAGTGTVTVTATVDGSPATGSASFTYIAPPPPASLTSISPISGPQAGGTAVMFTGTGFDVAPNATTFSFGSAAATGVNCSSSTSCTGTSPAGTGTVTVTATVDGSPATGSATFTYIAPPPPAPALTSISPSSGPAAGGTTVTFTGQSFDTAPGTTTFSFGGHPAGAVTCSSSTTCTGTSPAGAGSVTVTATVDGAPATGSAVFTFVASLSSITPSIGSAGTTVTITGRGFDTTAGNTQFRFGGTLATGVSCTSSTTCKAVVPAGGSGMVSVVAIVDGTQSSNSLGFRYRRK